MEFLVDLPKGYVFDNFAGAKMFQSCKLNVNHVDINNNSSEVDFYMDHYIDRVLNYESASLATTGSIQGIWSTHPYGSDLMISDKSEIDLRQARTYELTDGSKRYHFVFPLKPILARTPRPLPKDVTINISMPRTPARNSVIALALDDSTGNDAGKLDGSKPLPLINPTLRTKFFESDYYDRKLTPQRISQVPYPFTQKTVHRETLTSGQDNFKIRVCDGKLNFTFV